MEVNDTKTGIYDSGVTTAISNNLIKDASSDHTLEVKISSKNTFGFSSGSTSHEYKVTVDTNKDSLSNSSFQTSYDDVSNLSTTDTIEETLANADLKYGQSYRVYVDFELENSNT